MFDNLTVHSHDSQKINSLWIKFLSKKFGENCGNIKL